MYGEEREDWEVDRSIARALGASRENQRRNLYSESHGGNIYKWFCEDSGLDKVEAICSLEKRCLQSWKL